MNIITAVLFAGSILYAALVLIVICWILIHIMNNMRGRIMVVIITIAIFICLFNFALFSIH